MSNLIFREEKIKARHQQKTWKEFVKNCCSWYPLTLCRNNGLISIYPDNERSCPVIPNKDFEKTRDELTKHGIPYDFTKDFFENFAVLFKKVPFAALYNYAGAENADHAFSVYNSRNCYLAFTVITDCENVAYSFAVKEGCKNVFNSVQISNASENIYQSSCVFHGFNVFFSKFIENSSNIRCCNNMVGCTECLFCSCQQNASYMISNTQYEKQEYFTEKKKLLADKEALRMYYLAMKQAGENHGSTSTTESDFVINSENVTNGKYCFRLKHAKNVLIVGSPETNENMVNVFEAGSMGNRNFYGAMNAGVQSENIYNSEGIVTCHTVFYSRFLENCSFCLGCIGLKNKSFCILNKQYEKEERFDLVDKIFQQMDASTSSAPISSAGASQLGAFFPPNMNPFFFNDTVAYLVEDSFTKEEITAAGFLRREKEIKVDIPENMEIIETKNLSSLQSFAIDGTRTIDPTIMKKVIRDAEGNIYKIIPMEYEFLKKHNLPIPQVHWLQRIKLGF